MKSFIQVTISVILSFSMSTAFAAPQKSPQQLRNQAIKVFSKFKTTKDHLNLIGKGLGQKHFDFAKAKVRSYNTKKVPQVTPTGKSGILFQYAGKTVTVDLKDFYNGHVSINGKKISVSASSPKRLWDALGSAVPADKKSASVIKDLFFPKAEAGPEGAAVMIVAILTLVALLWTLIFGGPDEVVSNTEKCPDDFSPGYCLAKISKDPDLLAGWGPEDEMTFLNLLRKAVGTEGSCEEISRALKEADNICINMLITLPKTTSTKGKADISTPAGK